jgi:UDP-glucose 4-epimerase
MFENKTLLITGGTGSFGTTVLNRILATNIKEIRIFSRDEKKQEDLRIKLSNPKVKFFIGDVRDLSSLEDAVKGVDCIFHAAALKQVPSCEFYPMEAVKTNILGTENVLSAAARCGVERVVVLSTDKAVYPINAMGISKAMAEKIVVAKSRLYTHDGPIICVTRYGNVMASRGSVIPLFVNQLKSGRQLTVTEPEMTRFLMSLEDSVDLVLHAFEHAEPGDIFVQKAPASTVQVLADALLALFKSDAGSRVIGTRHGEKLYESLISREEMAKAIDMGRYYRVPADIRDLNYNKFFSEGETKIAQFEDYTSHNAERLDVEDTVQLLKKLSYIQEQLNA